MVPAITGFLTIILGLISIILGLISILPFLIINNLANLAYNLAYKQNFKS
jgi:uncharacterized membrane protein YbaN (DUF454 family)